jgi:hypothetical protein
MLLYSRKNDCNCLKPHLVHLQVSSDSLLNPDMAHIHCPPANLSTTCTQQTSKRQVVSRRTKTTQREQCPLVAAHPYTVDSFIELNLQCQPRIWHPLQTAHGRPPIAICRRQRCSLLDVLLGGIHGTERSEAHGFIRCATLYMGTDAVRTARKGILAL